MAQQPGYVLIAKTRTRLELDNGALFDEEIGETIAYGRPIFIVNGKRKLLFHLKPRLSQAGLECVLVTFFQMTGSMKLMNREARFANETAKFENLIVLGRTLEHASRKQIIHFVLFLRLFAAITPTSFLPSRPCR